MLVLSHVIHPRADAPTACGLNHRKPTTAELPSLSRLQPRRQSWLLVFPGRANPLQSLLSIQTGFRLKTSLQTAVTDHALTACQHGQIQFQRFRKQPPFGQPPPLGFPFVALGHFAGDACRNCKRTRGFRHLFALRLRVVYLDQIGSVHATSTGCKRNGPWRCLAPPSQAARLSAGRAVACQGFPLRLRALSGLVVCPGARCHLPEMLGLPPGRLRRPLTALAAGRICCSLGGEGGAVGRVVQSNAPWLASRRESGRRSRRLGGRRSGNAQSPNR